MRYGRLLLLALVAVGAVVGVASESSDHTRASVAPWYSLERVVHNPDPTGGDLFGYAVALPGGNVLATAPADDPGGVTDAGTAYLFDSSSGNPIMSMANPAPEASDMFGLAASANGSNIIVGAQWDRPGGVFGAGSAYLLDGTTGSTLLSIPNPFPASGMTYGGLFGNAVAALGTDILVGAEYERVGPCTGAAFLFDGGSGALRLTIPNPCTYGDDLFGVSVAAANGDILVGASHVSPFGIYRAGAVFLFDGTTGGLIRAIPDPALRTGDLFGYSVAALGSNFVVGAHWDDPGGVTNAGSVYVFDSTGSLLLTIPNPDPTAGDAFGYRVTTLGGNVFVSAPQDTVGGIVDAGSVYVFDGTTGALRQTISSPSPSGADWFGFSISAAGDQLLIGAPDATPGSLTDEGSAYLYCLDGDQDGACDGTDNCPSVATAWFVPAGDTDCDGFTSADEQVITTNPAQACGVNAWPVDFDDSHEIDITDVLALKPDFGANVPPASPRLDIYPDGVIDISDALAIKPFFGASCTP